MKSSGATEFFGTSFLLTCGRWVLRHSFHLYTTRSTIHQSFTSGRPPSTSLSFVDCDIPDDDEEQEGGDGQKLMGCTSSFSSRNALTQSRPDHRWNYEFIKVLSRVMAIAFTSQPPPYAAILDLDRELRDFYVPPHLRLQWMGQKPSDNLLWIKRWVVLSNKEWGK